MPHQLKSHPRKNGKDSRACRITGRTLGLVRKYELNLCRQAFREQAEHIGFVKYRWGDLWWLAIMESILNLNPHFSFRRALRSDNRWPAGSKPSPMLVKQAKSMVHCTDEQAQNIKSLMREWSVDFSSRRISLNLKFGPPRLGTRRWSSVLSVS